MSLWDDAWAYDLATAQFVDDLAYWTALIAELRPHRVLDLGCGTGRLSFPIATEGLAARPDFQLIGLDNSLPFLDRARARLISNFPALAGSVRFVEANMASFALEERFDLIVIAYNNLAYLITMEERIGCFTAIRSHLNSGGRLAIDVQTPPLELLSEAVHAVFPVVRHELEWIEPVPGINRFVSFFKTGSYDPVSQTESTTHYWEIYHADGRRQSLVKEQQWHHYFPCELRLLLSGSGLTPIAEYGDYDRRTFGPGSKIYLWMMKAS